MDDAEKAQRAIRLYKIPGCSLLMISLLSSGLVKAVRGLYGPLSVELLDLRINLVFSRDGALASTRLETTKH
jgi:hypothetical protein